MIVAIISNDLVATMIKLHFYLLKESQDFSWFSFFIFFEKTISVVFFFFTFKRHNRLTTLREVWYYSNKDRKGVDYEYRN